MADPPLFKRYAGKWKQGWQDFVRDSCQHDRHFWDTKRSSARKIGIIETKGTSYSKEDVVWHAWGHICRVYFPDAPVEQNENGPCYDIDREAYRGLFPAAPEAHVPDVIVVRCSNVVAQPGAPPVAGSERDILWVECKAPDMDKPNEWNRVITQVVRRLNSAHPNRMVYLILAVGLKWLPLIWDPTVPGQALTNPQGGPLRMPKQKPRGEFWDIDTRIYAAPIPNQRHIVSEGGRLSIDPTQAYTLNFWTLDPQIQPPRDPQPLNLADIDLLEAYFAQLQQTVFVGDNPARF